MNKQSLRQSAGSDAVKASLLVFFAALIMSIGCGKGIGLEHEIGDTNTAQCTSFYCSGNGGNTGTTNVGGAGGQGGSTTSVGGSGTGGHAGAASTGGAGGFGGNVTTGTGGSAGATNVGGAGGSGGATTTTSGTGGSGSAGTGGHAGAGGNTTTSTGTGGAGGATTTSTGTGGAGSSGTGGHDAGLVCAVDEKTCNNVCVKRNDPAYGCSDLVCSACPALANATSACDAFQDCVVGSCVAGFGNCDNNPSNGCETPTDSDPSNCGACGTVCGVNTLCQGGKCVQQPLNTLGWNGCVRDPLFDGFKINGSDVELIGGIWGTSGDDFYIAIATFSEAAIAHWYGGAFHLETMPDVGSLAYTVWGSGPDDVWFVTKEYLFHRDAQGVWSRDPNGPKSNWLVDVRGLDASHVYVVGGDKNNGGKVWMKSGTNWIAQILPSPMQPGDTGYSAYRVWAADPNHVFVTGSRGSLNGPSNGVLWTYNGSSWTVVQKTPVEVSYLDGIHGTSPQDFFVTGYGPVVGGTRDSYVYRVMNNASTWVPFVNKNFGGYGPVLSLKYGTFVAAGTQPPGGPGLARITVGDQAPSVTTYSVDNVADGIPALWNEPNTLKVHFAHRFPNPGHYVCTGK